MSWLTPLGFLGLIGLIILIIIYIIKPNYQNKIISSTFVWKLSLKYKKNKIPISKLRNILLLLCQIFAYRWQIPADGDLYVSEHFCFFGPFRHCYLRTPFVPIFRIFHCEFIIAYSSSLCGSAHILIIFAHISAKKIILGVLTTDFSEFFAKSLDKSAVL